MASRDALKLTARATVSATISLLLGAEMLFGGGRAHANEVAAAMFCGRIRHLVVDPIYMGRTITGLEQWACASSSGVNVRQAPYPVVVCNGIGQCRQVAWTY